MAASDLKSPTSFSVRRVLFSRSTSTTAVQVDGPRLFSPCAKHSRLRDLMVLLTRRALITVAATSLPISLEHRRRVLRVEFVSSALRSATPASLLVRVQTMATVCSVEFTCSACAMAATAAVPPPLQAISTAFKALLCRRASAIITPAPGQSPLSTRRRDCSVPFRLRPSPMTPSTPVTNLPTRASDCSVAFCASICDRARPVFGPNAPCSFRVWRWRLCSAPLAMATPASSSMTQQASCTVRLESCRPCSRASPSAAQTCAGKSATFSEVMCLLPSSALVNSRQSSTP
mmetsp:Transcript_20690/g.54826  ORF Transcript_20690/g.54826 Transcript_20690/m.54826 type:complete len:289 (-) Transcript_20690:240-1106(-)